MTIRLFVATTLAFATAGLFAGAAAADPPTGTKAQGCVGAIVSNAAHYWAAEDSIKGGLGAAAKEFNVNLGEAIQQAATFACGKHQ